MSYLSDFTDTTGWSGVDTNKKTSSTSGARFRNFMQVNSVELAVRYYASSRRSKTISKNEAQVLSNDGYALLPVYQDNARLTSDFGGTNGREDADAALDFVQYIGQPEGTTILFAVDQDFSEAQVRNSILPYFEEVQAKLAGRFRLGAYGSGLVLQTLLDEGLIEVPWLSMSRLFRGTKDFFYSEAWAFRQLPPDLIEPNSGFPFDRNTLNWPLDDLGAFRFDENGLAVPVGRAFVPVAPTARLPEPLSTDVVYVATDGLNLREGPSGLEPSKRELTIGSKLQNLGAGGSPGWRQVSHEGETGFVSDRYLRDPQAPEVEALLESAISEWVRFLKGDGDEKVSPFKEYVGEMWQSIGLNYDGASTYVDSDGVTREIPWSAAFISFVVKKSGPMYDRFFASQRHSDFVHDSIQARFLDLKDRPFWGYRRTERKPAIGDIVQRNRGRGSFTFDWAETHSRYSSHSDIVIEARPDVIRVLGGNVSDTVAFEVGDGQNLIQEYRLDESGYIAPGQRVISLLKNRAHLVVPAYA